MKVHKARKVCRVQTRQCPVPLARKVSLVRWDRKVIRDRRGRKA
jgi:hypothetical protein